MGDAGLQGQSREGVKKDGGEYISRTQWHSVTVMFTVASCLGAMMQGPR
jgi:hypothetical protein